MNDEFGIFIVLLTIALVIPIAIFAGPKVHDTLEGLIGSLKPYAVGILIRLRRFFGIPFCTGLLAGIALGCVGLFLYAKYLLRDVPKSYIIEPKAGRFLFDLQRTGNGSAMLREDTSTGEVTAFILDSGDIRAYNVAPPHEDFEKR